MRPGVKRAAAGLIVVLCVLLTAFMSVCMVSSLHHTCRGHRCPVCDTIALIRQVRYAIMGGVLLFSGFLFLSAMPVCGLGQIMLPLSDRTPVHCKIRLNN